MPFAQYKGLPSCTIHLHHDVTCNTCFSAYAHEKNMREIEHKEANKERADAARRFIDAATADLCEPKR